VNDSSQKNQIIKTLIAMEDYVLFANIVMGIIQMFCLNYEGNIKVSAHRYLRTPSRQVISEASMMKYLGRNLFRFMAKEDNLTITKIITSKQLPVECEEMDLFVC
jgi:hypothetical protein